MARKFIPAWERTVRIALESTPWDSLPPEEQQAVQLFVTERHKGDADKASALLTQLIPRVQPRKALPLGVIILLWVLALIVAPVLCFAFGTKWLAPALLVYLICALCTGKKNRMRKLWHDRPNGAEGVSAALKAMFRVTLKSPLKAETVKLELANRLIGVVTDRYGTDVFLSPGTDGQHFFATVEVALSPQFYAWVFSFGKEARIVSPAYVAEDFRTRLQEALEGYAE